MVLNKKSISWYEDGQKNRGLYLQQQKERIKQLQENLKDSQEKYNKTERQIQKAKKLGLTEFDENQAAFKNL